MINRFRHRQQIRKHEKHHSVMSKRVGTVSFTDSWVGAVPAGAPDSGKFLPTQVVIITYYR